MHLKRLTGSLIFFPLNKNKPFEFCVSSQVSLLLGLELQVLLQFPIATSDVGTLDTEAS
jgi:hypothetical protein